MGEDHTYTDSQEWEETESHEEDYDYEQEEYREDPGEYGQEESPEDHEGYGQDEASEEAGSGSDEADLGERIDSLLEQIGYEKDDYGTMGDYYIKEIGCYVYPDADVFSRFVDAELEGAGWAEASNGCFVPVEYLGDYESYISRNSADVSGEGTEEAGEGEELPEEPAVSLEDFNGLKDILLEMADQDADFYESVAAYMEADAIAMEGVSFQLSVISCVLIVICVFLALLAGNRFADIFFNRMRVG